MKKAVFLDRDGTINVEKDYLYKIEDFEWETGAKEAIKIFKELGYVIVVVTNQSGVARGYYKEEDVVKLHNFMNEELAKEEAEIDSFYYCPHHEKGIPKYAVKCRDRKPETAFFEQAQKVYEIDYESSFVVGDKISDLEAAVRLGMTPVLVKTGHGKEEEKKVYMKSEIYENLYEFALNLKERKLG